jgi:hypothetical protein
VSAGTDASNDGYGIYNVDSSKPTVSDSTIIATGTTSYGVFSDVGGSAVIRDSSVSGGIEAIVSDAIAITLVSDTLITGGVSGGSFICVDNFDTAYAPVPGC